MLAVAAAGGDGWALTVTTVVVEIQVGSASLLTRILCVPAATPVKVVDDWYAPPSMLYSYAPIGAVITIVPVEVEQVGCMVVLAVAAAGGDGCAFTVTEVEDEIQLWSTELLTRMLCDPAATPAKVVDAWYVPASILYSYNPSGAVTTTVPVDVEQVG